MRDLTEEEIREYLDWAHRNKPDAAFGQEQVQMIAQAVIECGLMNSCAKKVGEILIGGATPEEAFRSLWVMAFQMGRECESRLLTRTLTKGAKV